MRFTVSLFVLFFCFLLLWVPMGSPSRGGVVVVYVFDINQQSLPTSFYSVSVSISVFVALSTVFHSINSFNNSAFSFCSSSPKSALSALSTIYLFLKVSLSPDVIPSGWHCLEHQLTNSSSVIDSCGRVSLPVQRRQQSWLSFTGHQGTPELVVEWSFACPNLKMLFFTEGADL